MSLINSGVSENLRRLAHDTLIEIRENLKDNRHWMVFPFNVYSGYIPFTETGWKPNNAKPSDYGNYSRIFTGRESVIAQWQESLRIYQKGKGQEINLLTEEDFINQPINTGIIANHQSFWAIKENNNLGDSQWRLNIGEIITNASDMVKYTEIYTLTYFTPDGKQDNFYTKEAKVGKYWDAYIIDDTSSIQFGEVKYDQIFTQQSTDRQYTLLILDEDISRLNINDYYNFFVVFNDRGLNIGGGDVNSVPQDRQWLYPSNVINYYSPWNGSFLWQQITFSSINDRISSSGLSVLQFIQTSAPGEGYTFPKITYDEKLNKGIVELDPILLKDPGVQYAVVRLFGMGGIGAFPIFGRPVIPGKFNERVQNSRPLLASNIYPAPPNPVNTYSTPDTTWFNVLGVQPTIVTGYDNWKSDMEARYDFWNQKNNEGIIITDPINTPNTNNSLQGVRQIGDDNNSKMFWAKNWKYQQPSKLKIDGQDVDNIVNTQTSRYFRKQINSGINIGKSLINYNSLGKVNIWDYLNLNAFVFNQFPVLPLNETQKLPFTPFSIPILGKFLNVVSFSIPWGWVINQDETLWPNFQFLNMFMSANTYNFYNKIFWSENSRAKGYLPWEAFRQQGNDKVGGTIGANASSIGLTLKLTDKVNGPTLNEDGSTRDSKIWSTYNIGQQNPNSKEIYLMSEDVKAVDKDSELDKTELDPDLIYNQTANGANESYIIDLFNLYAIFKGEFQVDFYSQNPFTFSEQNQNQYSVWQWRGKTENNLTNSLRNWCTNYKTSFLLPHEYEIPTFNYPAYIIPPNPLKFQDTEIIFLNSFESKIGSYSNQALPQCTQLGELIGSSSSSENDTNAIYEYTFDLKTLNEFVTSLPLFKIMYKKIKLNGFDKIIINFSQLDMISSITSNNNIITQGDNTCNETISDLKNAQLYSQGKFLESPSLLDNIITIDTNELTNTEKEFVIVDLPDSSNEAITTYTLTSAMTIENVLYWNKQSNTSSFIISMWVDSNLILHIKFNKVIKYLISLFGKQWKGMTGNNLTITSNSFNITNSTSDKIYIDIIARN